jgi:hypothetical protein
MTRVVQKQMTSEQRGRARQSARTVSQSTSSWRETAMRVLRAIGGSANGIVHLHFDDHSPALYQGHRSGATVIGSAATFLRHRTLISGRISFA